MRQTKVIVPLRHERLFLERRRMRLSQRAMAEGCGVALVEYRRWETGEEQFTFERDLRRRAFTPHELAVVVRRRKGVTQRELALRLGCCRWWLNKMENGAADPRPLLKHWGIAAPK